MIAYLDCFSGISGDMLLGALVDAGVAPDALRAGLAGLPLAGYTLEFAPVTEHGIHGTRATVALDPAAPVIERRLSDTETILAAGALPPRVQQRAVRIFRLLAEAEAKIHGTPVEAVHFHEVGAVDAIVDIVGATLGLEILEVDAVYCSELPLTSGRVRSAHGNLPVPAPATLELLRETGAVWQPLDIQGELVTPTGAAIAAALARFQRPVVAARAIGYGFGRRALPWANCLRLLVGEEHDSAGASFERDVVMEIEANLDNMTGEALGWLMERLLAAGALDVSYTPLVMKKQRPGVRLTALAALGDGEALAQLILRESATLGVRMGKLRRMKAGRREERVTTPLGEARVKLKLIGRTAAISIC